MKITLEPTDNRPSYQFPQHAVTISTPHDDLNIQEVADLLEFVLLAWGFAPECVKEVLPNA